MSKVSELVDEEAAKAEAESPDEEEAGSTEVEGQEGEQEAPAEPAPSGEPTEEDKKAFDTEQARHAEALRAIMGPDFDLLEPCDACGTWGYAPPQQLKTHERYRMCPVCNGFGVVLTGARSETNATAMCPACAGRGFQELTTQQGEPAPVAAAPANGEASYGLPTMFGDPNVKPEPTYGPPS